MVDQLTKPKFDEFVLVALTTDLPMYRLRSGDIGTVVDVVHEGRAYVIKFITLLGKTVAVVEVAPDAIRRVEPDEIANARPLQVAV
jgi:hypothetical protein